MSILWTLDLGPFFLHRHSLYSGFAFEKKNLHFFSNTKNRNKIESLPGSDMGVHLGYSKPVYGAEEH